MSETIDLIFDSILDGNDEALTHHIDAALKADVSPEIILNEGMIAAMDEVGRLFEEGEYFVPEMLVSARAMKAGLALLRPYLMESNVEPLGIIVLGTVAGDLHDIGKNLVGMMLEGAGLSVIDLGTDVPTGKFVDVVRETDVDIIGLSALLTTTMPSIKATIDGLEEAGLRNKTKVIVGGAPLTLEFAEKIGADGYAPDASKSVALVKSLLK